MLLVILYAITNFLNGAVAVPLTENEITVWNKVNEIIRNTDRVIEEMNEIIDQIFNERATLLNEMNEIIDNIYGHLRDIKPLTHKVNNRLRDLSQHADFDDFKITANQTHITFSASDDPDGNAALKEVSIPWQSRPNVVQPVQPVQPQSRPVQVVFNHPNPSVVFAPSPLHTVHGAAGHHNHHHHGHHK
jgi:uncharacterized protein YoxC